jgi:hypothetical protein
MGRAQSLIRQLVALIPWVAPAAHLRTDQAIWRDTYSILGSVKRQTCANNSRLWHGNSDKFFGQIGAKWLDHSTAFFDSGRTGTGQAQACSYRLHNATVGDPMLPVDKDTHPRVVGYLNRFAGVLPPLLPIDIQPIHVLQVRATDAESQAAHPLIANSFSQRLGREVLNGQY